MSRIRGKDTKPEMLVRRLLHSSGYRYRVHVADLPGKPDIVFTRKRRVIFVNGCFWHSHDCRYGRVVPATNSEFWANKRDATVARDASKSASLEQLGWTVITVWECETRDMETLTAKLFPLLNAARTRSAIGSTSTENS